MEHVALLGSEIVGIFVCSRHGGAPCGKRQTRGRSLIGRDRALRQAKQWQPFGFEYDTFSRSRDSPLSASRFSTHGRGCAGSIWYALIYDAKNNRRRSDDEQRADRRIEAARLKHKPAIVEDRPQMFELKELKLRINESER